MAVTGIQECVRRGHPQRSIGPRMEAGMIHMARTESADVLADDE